MLIRLLSDLHYEFYSANTFYQEPFLEYCGEDVTVLAGDIGVGANQIKGIFKFMLAQGHQHIVYVPGNHEFYGSDYSYVMDRLVDVCSDFGNKVTLLQPDMLKVIDDVVFFGGTLWTNFGKNPACEVYSKQAINDFKVIKNFTTELCKQLYYKDLQSIQSIYSQVADKKKVIVTHFLPAMECVHPMYAGGKVNQYFANDLGEWIKTLDNTVWLFGHTHHTTELQLGTTRLYCNPHGYLTENSLHFNSAKLIEV